MARLEFLLVVNIQLHQMGGQLFWCKGTILSIQYQLVTLSTDVFTVGCGSWKKSQEARTKSQDKKLSASAQL